MDEFELIRRYFDRRDGDSGIMTGIGDDGAVLGLAKGMEQVQVIDTLVEGVHFPVDTDAADIGFRVVAVNLSDVAAMGARPRYMTLALTHPDKGERWIADFARGLFTAADQFGVVLIGGDMTSGESVVATVHMTGEVAAGQALLRSGARVGDTVFVSGTCGDAAGGLELRRHGTHDDFLLARFLRPAARVDLGAALVGRAHAVIDVSDGLLGDLRKLLQASGVGAEIHVDRVPISDPLSAHFDAERALRLALTGGDDYELCFAARADDVDDIRDVTAIGTITQGNALTCYRDGQVVRFDDSGYRHFA